MASSAAFAPSCSPSAGTGAVIQDLLLALQDEDLTDVSLIGDDGVEVRACRFVLAARSKVLKRMLYGNFREATSTNIELPYSGAVLQAVVEYCTKNMISDKFLHSNGGNYNAKTVRQLVNLAKAGDFFDISCLVRDAESLVQKLVSKNPILACPIFDESDEFSTLHEYSRKMIRCRPYVALLPSEDDTSGGGIECLRTERIVELMQETEIEAGETFLFEMLQRWVVHAGEGKERQEALQVAKKCGEFFRLDYIEPQELLSTVQKSGLFAPNLIVEAIMRQALRASEDRVWTVNCRGPPSDLDRVLVEGCGKQEVNGVYHRIRGLNKGDVYSKREVNCGQLLVYTLSCSQRKDEDVIESRIFCSKVLTHRAVRTLQTTQVGTPAFQPLLQVIKVERPNRTIRSRSPFAKLYKVRRKFRFDCVCFLCFLLALSLITHHVSFLLGQVQVSDGDNYMTGTLAEDLSSLCEEQQIVENSLLKILAYEQYQLDNKQCLHVTDLSFVGAHPGHTLGNPVKISMPLVVAPVGTETLGGPEGDKLSSSSASDDGLQKLYSCHYPMDQQPKDTKIPRTGWTVEDDGVDPPPTCTWIPATGKRFGGDASTCPSSQSSSPSRS